ncbi:MAG: hypothetical protein DSM106950_42960 [Stigonema ocellatum SAG 48.90 = DSM 106950]|nr:hypothetical protein [Stigonema ocellatum SAG 48.90 = DSM 106950]
MDESQLITELLEGLTKDIKALKARVEKLPTQTPADYGTRLDELTKAVQSLQSQAKPTPPTIDLSPLTSRLDRLEQAHRQSPERKMSQYLQVGAYGFGLMVVLLMAVTWFALSWRSERDAYEQAFAADNWRIRYTKQANPDYYSFMEAKFKDTAIYKWIGEQEEADQKRELAREAAEQAKALSRQANELEGKEMTKGKKKGQN